MLPQQQTSQPTYPTDSAQGLIEDGVCQDIGLPQDIAHRVAVWVLGHRAIWDDVSTKDGQDAAMRYASLLCRVCDSIERSRSPKVCVAAITLALGINTPKRDTIRATARRMHVDVKTLFVQIERQRTRLGLVKRMRNGCMQPTKVTAINLLGVVGAPSIVKGTS